MSVGTRGAVLLRLTVPGEPVGKGRPRAVRAGLGVRMVTPDKTAAWEARALAQAQAVHQGPAIARPVNVAVRAVKARPAALLAKKHLDGRMLRTVKPDLDNVIKAALDALVLAGVLDDDTFVVGLDGSRSLFCARGEAPCVELIVTAIDP